MEGADAAAGVEAGKPDLSQRNDGAGYLGQDQGGGKSQVVAGSDASAGATSTVPLAKNEGDGTGSKTEHAKVSERKPSTQKLNQIAQAWGERVTGNKGVAFTDRNEEIEYQWAVVEADGLNVSNEDSGAVSNEYPSHLQPRDRQSAGSQLQVDEIANNSNFYRLSNSESVGGGAPIVGGDAVVESGNGRAMGLRRAYGRGLESVQKYKENIAKNAAAFGVDAEKVMAMKNPMLVRERVTPLTEEQRVKFAEGANVSNVAPMREIETARKDARNLVDDPSVMSLFVSDEGKAGDILSTANMPFVTAFMQKIVPRGEIGGLIDKNSGLSQTGLRRIRNAIFVYAYGDSMEGMTALGRMTESVEDDAKQLTNALLGIAPAIARQNARIAAGELYPLGIAGDLLTVAQTLIELRDRGETVEKFAAQGNLFSEDGLSPSQAELLKFLDKNRRSAKRVIRGLACYAGAVEAAGDPRQATFLADVQPTKEAVWKIAMAAAEAESKPLNAGQKADAEKLKQVVGMEPLASVSSSNAIRIFTKLDAEASLTAGQESTKQSALNKAATATVNNVNRGELFSAPKITAENIKNYAGSVNVSALASYKDKIGMAFDVSLQDLSEKRVQIVPLSKLVSLKNELEDQKFLRGEKKDPRQTAADWMVKAIEGEEGAKKRAPLDVSQNADGTFTIRDGNATAQAAMLAGWTKVPVKVVDSVLHSSAKPKKVMDNDPYTNFKKVLAKYKEKYDLVIEAKKKEPKKTDAQIIKEFGERYGVEKTIKKLAEVKDYIEKCKPRKPEFDETIKGLAEEFGGEAKYAELKKAARSVEKLLEKDRGADSLKDVIRATIVVDTVEQAVQVLNAIEKKFKLYGDLENRFANPTDVGYMDGVATIEYPDGTKAEIQISIPEMMEAKEIAHIPYEFLRSLPKWKNEAEFASFDILTSDSRELYQAAYWAYAARKEERNSAAHLRSNSSAVNRLAGAVLPNSFQDRISVQRPQEQSKSLPSGVITMGSVLSQKNLEPSGKSDARGDLSFGVFIQGQHTRQGAGGQPTILHSGEKSSVTPEQDARYLELAKDPVKNREELQRMVDERVKAIAVDYPNESYRNAPDSLMGYRREGRANKSYEESLGYKTEIVVVVEDGGDVFVDGMRGLNVPHAMERARRNWDGAKIKFAGIGTPYPVTYDNQGNIIPLSKRFDQSKDSSLYASEKPTASEANSVKIYQKLAGMKREGIALSSSQLALLEKVEKSLGQRFMFEGERLEKPFSLEGETYRESVYRENEAQGMLFAGDKAKWTQLDFFKFDEMKDPEGNRYYIPIWEPADTRAIPYTLTAPLPFIYEDKGGGFTVGDSAELFPVMEDAAISVIEGVRSFLDSGRLFAGKKVEFEELTDPAGSGNFSSMPENARAAESSGQPSRGGSSAEVFANLRRVRGSDQVRSAAVAFLNKPLINDDTGIFATVSATSLKKLLSLSSVSRSVSQKAHMMALGNLDFLFKEAVAVMEREPKKESDAGDVRKLIHFMVPMPLDGNVMMVKIMAKEFVDSSKGSRIYLVSAVEIEKAEVVGGDPVLSGQSQSEVAPTSPPPLGKDKLTRLVKEVKGLVFALFLP